MCENVVILSFCISKSYKNLKETAFGFALLDNALNPSA